MDVAVDKFSNICYNAIKRYFTNLKNVGYMPYNEVYKLMKLLIIEDLVNHDFDGCITESLYNKIDKVLYQLYGTSCLIPYPKYCSNMNRVKLRTISELAYRISNIENTVVLEPNTTEGQEVVDPIPDENN